MDTQQVETLNSSPHYIGISKRFVALVIDNLITVLLVFIVLLGNSEPQSAGKSAAYLVVLFLVPWMYSVLLESSPEQATLGKMALGIIVVDRDGKRISFAEANLRYFGKAIWSIIIITALVFYYANPVSSDGKIPPSVYVIALIIMIAVLAGMFGYLMPAFNFERQALHDRMAKTFVIDAETRSKRLPQKALLQIAAVALVSGIVFHFIPDGSTATDPSVDPPAPSPTASPSPGTDSADISGIQDIKPINFCGVSERTIPASSHDYIDGVWKVEFTGQEATPHRSVLIMKGTSGIMRTEFPDPESQSVRAVLQDMQLRSSPTRLWLLGANPVDAETKKPVEYSPDNLFLQLQPDGQFLAFNCDSLGRSSLATFQFIREKP